MNNNGNNNGNNGNNNQLIPLGTSLPSSQQNNGNSNGQQPFQAIQYQRPSLVEALPIVGEMFRKWRERSEVRYVIDSQKLQLEQVRIENNTLQEFARNQDLRKQIEFAPIKKEMDSRQILDNYAQAQRENTLRAMRIENDIEEEKNRHEMIINARKNGISVQHQQQLNHNVSQTQFNIQKALLDFMRIKVLSQEAVDKFLEEQEQIIMNEQNITQIEKMKRFRELIDGCQAFMDQLNPNGNSKGGAKAKI